MCWKKPLFCIIVFCLAGCEQYETSQSAQAEAANHLRNLGISVIPDDNGVIWSLIINQPEFQTTDFKHIRAFPNLKYVDLSDSSLDDEGMKYLNGLVSLEKIYISNTKISDRGVESLKGLKRLVILDLSETSITDKSLETLKGLPSLEHVKIMNTSVSEEAVLNLQKSHPKIKFRK